MDKFKKQLNNDKKAFKETITADTDYILRLVEILENHAKREDVSMLTINAEARRIKELVDGLAQSACDIRNVNDRLKSKGDTL